MLSLGGGNTLGKFTVEALDQITKDLSLVIDANYTGIVFDVEKAVGSSSDLIPAFNDAFRACKDLRLSVAITTSHSAPYATDTPQDAIDLVKAWASNPNVDILSPQLYSSGVEGAPEFYETSSCVDSGCTWNLYLNSIATFAPSVVDETHVSSVTE